MIELQELKIGDCFIFNNEPYIIKRVYWEDLGLFTCKRYVCKMKFKEENITFSNVEIKVNKISKDSYNLL